MEEHSNNVVRTDDVIGKKVMSFDNESLGKIEEIVLDKVSGTCHYVVLSFGGFLGMGDKYFALPWKSISYNTDVDGFVLNVDKDRLKNAPGFDKDNWPDFADQTYQKSLSDFYQ